MINEILTPELVLAAVAFFAFFILVIIIALIVAIFNISKETTQIRKLIEARIDHDGKEGHYKIDPEEY